jgi:hypothetical protein
MSFKKPLVITNGQIERLQAGDQIDLGNTVSKSNTTGVTLPKCTPVYVSSNNMIPAQADAQSTVAVAGLVDADTTNNTTGNVVTDGVFEATTGDWDVVTGDTGGLTIGADYWLDAAAAGALTSTAPDVDGDFVKKVGHALTTTQMDIEIGQTVKL